MSVKKKKRQTNFSANEKFNLFNLINEKYKRFIENKATDKTTNVLKDEAWTELTNDFNASSSMGLYRDKDFLKRFYENRKRDVKKIAAKNRQEIIRTGGGPEVKVKLDPADALLISIMNKKSTEGLTNYYDSDIVNEPLQNPAKKMKTEQELFLNRTGREDESWYSDVAVEDGKSEGDTEEDLDVQVVWEENNEMNFDQSKKYSLELKDIDEFNNMKKPKLNITDERPKFMMDSALTSSATPNSRPKLKNANAQPNDLDNNETMDETLNMDTPQFIPSKTPTFKMASDLKLPKNTALKVPYVEKQVTADQKQMKSNSRSRMGSRGRRGGRCGLESRRTGITILSSSHIAQKYDELLDLRKTLIQKQIKIADQDLTFQSTKQKLEIEILKATLAKQNQNN